MGWGDVANGKGYIDPYGFSKGGGGKGSWGDVANGSGYIDPYGFSKTRAPKGGGGHHGGGLFGWLGSKASLAGHDIAGLPGGTLHLVEAALPSRQDIEHPLRFNAHSAGQQWGGFLTHPIREQQRAARGRYGKEAQGAAAQLGGLVGAARQSLEHPLRDPFQTALTLAPGLHGLGRAGEIASGIDATAPRTLRMGEAKVGLPPASGNAAIRAGQRLYGRVLQHGLDTNPEGRIAAHAAKRIGGSLQETARYQARMREVPAQLLAHAGRELRGSLGKHVPFTGAKAAEAALRLTSENTLPEEAAAFHRAQAAKGVEAAANNKLAHLYEHIGAREMLKQDEHGNVAVNADKFPKLAHVDTLLSRAQQHAERIVGEHQLMTEAGQRARLNAPAAVRAGLGDVHAARVRLAELDRAHQQLLEKLVPEVSPYANRAAEQLRRNFENSRAGKGRYRALTHQPTVKDEELALAEDRLHEIIARHPHAPGVAEARQLVEERAALRDYLNRHAEASMFGEPEPGLTGTPREGRGYVPYRPTEPRAPRGAQARIGASGVVGKPRSPISAQHFTGEALEHGQVPDATTGLVARHLQGLYRFVNTDALRRQALETGSDVKRSSRDILVRNPDVPAGKISTEIERSLGRKHVTLDELAQLEGHRQALADHMRHIVGGGYNAEAATQEARLAPAVGEARRYGIGQQAPSGFRWVDRNVFGDLGNAFALSRGRVGRFGDAVNSAVTTATVYLKPGHFPQRLLTNAGTNLIQGSAAPLQLAGSVRLWRSLSHEDRIRALGAAGQGGYEAMPHDAAGLVGEQAAKAASWWAKHVDAPFRFASIAYEARKAGYRTPGAFRRFLHILEQPDRFTHEEVLRADGIAKQANRAGIAYDRLGDAEKRTIGRVVWFYPWVKGASLYAGRAFLNHPFKGSIMAQLGEQGRQQQQSILGAVPSYEIGLMPTGHGKVSDLQRLFPFSTAADVLQIPEHPSALAGNANPAVAAALGGLLGINGFGSPAYGSRLSTALDNLDSSLPEVQILKAYLARHKDQSQRMFPSSPAWGGTRDQILRALLGVATPRRVNKAALAKAVAREKAGR